MKLIIYYLPEEKNVRVYIQTGYQIEKLEKIIKFDGSLKVALHSPKETAKIMSKIYLDDQKISYLVKKLSK